VLPRLRSDLLDVLVAATRQGGLQGVRLEWSSDWAVTVVLAGGGYPASSAKGDLIAGLDELPDEVEVTHAGTASVDGAIVTAGGRVLNLTGVGADRESARAAAYAAAQRVSFDGMQLRSDIGSA
jgi:phosphoribosylamine--glycine ligase